MNKNQWLTLVTLFKNVVIRKKKYVLKFYAKSEEGLLKRWYYDWNKNHKCTWGFEEGNLEIVAGADKLCEKYAKGKNEVTVHIIASRNEITPPIGYVMYKRKPLAKGKFERVICGADYEGVLNDSHFWICPVTLFVLGRYPKYIYIKEI